MTVIFSHPAMEAITMWGFWENTHWRPDAALYRSDWSEKPALTAYQDLVFDAWWTEELGVSDDLGELMLRGFKGEYDITVTYNGQEYILPVTLNDDMSVTVTLPFAIGPAGDYNGDGAIDAADYVVWRANNTAGQQGYDDWRSNFGTGTGLASNAAVVPEPASAAGALIAVMSLFMLRRARG